MNIINKITSLEQQLLSITNQLKTLKLQVQVKGDTPKPKPKPKPKGLFNRLHLFTAIGKAYETILASLGCAAGGIAIWCCPPAAH